MLWIVGGFLFCPCHLPITLAVLGAALTGTALGAAFREHPVAAGIVITAIWAIAWWRGFRLLGAAEGSL